MDSHGEAYRVDGEDATPDALPLDREIGFDAMHFAWHGYYPDTEYVNAGILSLFKDRVRGISRIDFILPAPDYH